MAAIEHRGLSPSSLSMFTSCQRKFWLKKIAKVPIDTDASDDYEAFNLGKSFHKALEDTKHELDGYQISSLAKVCEEFGVEGDKVPMVFAMLSSYKAMHEKAGLKAIAFETVIETDSFFGIVDVVLGTPDAFWVGDMKTAATYSPSIIASLPLHPQLNLYAAHYKELALKLNLNPEGYKGCRYRVTTKSKLIQKKDETPGDYIVRMRNGIKSVDIVLPKEKMNPMSILSVHTAALSHMTVNKENESAFCQNFGNCLSYFRPCEFWSRCHGSNYTADRGLEVIEA